MITLGEQAEDVGERVINPPTTRLPARSPTCRSPGHCAGRGILVRFADHCAIIHHARRVADCDGDGLPVPPGSPHHARGAGHFVTRVIGVFDEYS
jgi:hypothetical protein